MVESATRLSDHPEADAGFLEVLGSPLVRVSSLFAAVRRRRRVWIAAALAGALASLAYFVVQGPRYSASTTLLLRRTSISPQDPSRAMQTDVQLATSRNVAGRALSQLQLPESVQQFQAEYTASPATDDILKISASAPTSAEAVRRADAVANAFLDFRGQSTQRETQVQIAALQQQRNTLQTQVRPLDDQISAATLEVGSSTTQAAANALGDLLARRAQINGQIASVQQRISDVTADSAAVVANSRVVDPAVAQPRSVVKTAVLDVAVGALGALALGIGWVLVVEATSNRVRRRRDVTVGLGAPVAVSVGPIGPPGRLGRRARLSSLSPSRPGPDLAKVARHLRAVLARTHPSPTPALAVVSVDSDEVAGLAAASAVHGLLADGNDVLAIDLSADSALAGHFGVAPNTVSLVEQVTGDAKLWVVSRSPAEGSSIDDWLQLHNLRDETEAVVVLAALDPADGAGHLAGLVSTAVAVVTSGCSTVATLRATRQMLHAAGVRLDSAMLVGADPEDESFGMAASAVPPPAWA